MGNFAAYLHYSWCQAVDLGTICYSWILDIRQERGYNAKKHLCSFAPLFWWCRIMQIMWRCTYLIWSGMQFLVYRWLMCFPLKKPKSPSTWSVTCCSCVEGAQGMISKYKIYNYSGIQVRLYYDGYMKCVRCAAWVGRACFCTSNSSNDGRNCLAGHSRFYRI